jgi:addiction module HigA family antidote
MLRNRKPTHPGAILREDVLPTLGLTQKELARRLGVSRRTVSEIVHERRPVTPDMALRLARLLGGSAESWLNMQRAVDLWELQRERTEVYDRIEPVASSG